MSRAGVNGAGPVVGADHHPADLDHKADALTEALRSVLDLAERNHREVEGLRDDFRRVRDVLAACLPPCQ